MKPKPELIYMGVVVDPEGWAVILRSRQRFRIDTLTIRDTKKEANEVMDALLEIYPEYRYKNGRNKENV